MHGGNGIQTVAASGAADLMTFKVPLVVVPLMVVLKRFLVFSSAIVGGTSTGGGAGADCISGSVTVPLVSPSGVVQVMTPLTSPDHRWFWHCLFLEQ